MPDIVKLWADDSPPESNRPAVQVLRSRRGLIAFAPWDNDVPGSPGAARYLDGKWTKLDASNGWPQKLVSLILLLDGSVAQLFINEQGKFEVAIAPFDPAAPSAT